jgi:hypothetical protein
MLYFTSSSKNAPDKVKLIGILRYNTLEKQTKDKGHDEINPIDQVDQWQIAHKSTC